MDKNTQAFPIIVPEDGYNRAYLLSNGMLLRDWFAGQALTGMLGHMSAFSSPLQSAEWAYQFADALMEQREK